MAKTISGGDEVHGGQQTEPSKFVDSERGMRNWWKQQQKLLNAGELKPERMEQFNQLLEMGDRYKHVNQYK